MRISRSKATMTRRSKATMTAAVAAMVALLAACSGSTAADDSAADAGSGSSTVRMATLPWIGYGPWYIAEEDGIFADNGLTVEQTTFNTDADLNAAFISGNVDVANVATHTALLMKQAGVPVKVVLVEDISTTADAIIAPASVTSVEGLKGLRIAYEQGTTSDLLLNYALDSVGLTPGDVVPVPMAASDAGAALIGGKVDAAVTYEPYITAALAESADLGLLFSAGELPGLISDVLVVSDDYIDSNPDAISALIASWGASIDSYDADTDAGRAIIAEAVGEEAEALVTAFEGVTFYDGAMNATDLGGDFTSSTIPLVLKAAQSAGIITGEVDVADLIDTQFVTR